MGSYFDNFSSTKDDCAFNFRINPHVNIHNIEIYNTGSIVLYIRNKPIEISGDITPQIKDKKDGDLYFFKPKDSLRKISKRIAKDSPATYFKIKLNNQNNQLFNNYNYENDWIYPIELFKQKEIAEKNCVKWIIWIFFRSKKS